MSDAVGSAALSLLVSVFGTLLTLLTVGRLTVSRMKAEEQVAARRAVRAAVMPIVRDIERYRRGQLNGFHRAEDAAHAEDGVRAAQVHAAAENLVWWRAVLVRRRCRRVFGKRMSDLGRDFADQPTQVGATRITADLLLNPRGRPSEELRAGLLHQGLRADRRSAVTRKLVRELRKLASSR
ncbi:hypothetical protein QDR37_09140 [Amnibacterium sp. CER49]|uniref:hypothetical protein n=1 Tax=Amnibacterium sp. CER49 TaxID=3039161 RepID=UPI00244CF710|nr:hypothetical protein [Amnibacterium sp. CER49]MDH2444109.1 hypothetical protein [Amnibacterium sp. CER49]